MKKILIISNSKIESDPRVYKQVLFLKNHDYYIVTAGKTPSKIENDFIDISYDSIKLKDIFSKPSIQKLFKFVQEIFRRKFNKLFLLKLQLFDKYYWKLPFIVSSFEKITKCEYRFDLIIANDILVLPLAVKLAKINNSKVYIDAHEYEPLHFNSFSFNFFYRDFWYFICKKYLPLAHYMTTVCDGIAEEYRRNFNVKCDVMMNVPMYEDIRPVIAKPGKIRLIHHGAAQKGRCLENMIELMDYLDERFELDFMLLKMDSKYGNKLRKLASKNNKIRFIPTVKMTEIVSFINIYDIGLYLLTANTFNQKMALPNKIFEFIQARLAVAIWPSQEMVKIIDRYEIGIYSNTFKIIEIADKLNDLTVEKINEMKLKSDIASKELNAEMNKLHLYKIVDKLLE